MAKSPKSLNDIFVSSRHSNNLSQYEQKTRQFRQILQALTELLGDNIAQNLIVSNFNDCILQIDSRSAAVATHLKMRQSEILSLVRQQFNPATVTINVSVNPKSFALSSTARNTPNEQSDQGSNSTNSSSKRIPTVAANAIDELANNSSGKLKEALTRLAQHKK